MSELKLLLIVHAGVTLMMTGAIWIIQIVHYPLFSLVGSAGYTAYQNAHMSAITLVVGPLMLAEAATGAWLLFDRPAGVTLEQAALGLVLIGVVWAMTLFVNGPQHAALSSAFDPETHAALVSSNWIRTLAWTLRGGLVLWMLAGALSS
ncbi:MAG: hypothetical protein SNJ59_12450 [Aggregatilineales bacterium]